MSKIGEKAERLARDGLVEITSRTENVVEGRVAASDPEADWWTVRVTPAESRCTCPASEIGRRLCSHIRALELYERFGWAWAAEQRAKERAERRIE